jgi:hypothetical protein
MNYSSGSSKGSGSHCRPGNRSYFPIANPKIIRTTVLSDARLRFDRLISRGEPDIAQGIPQVKEADKNWQDWCCRIQIRETIFLVKGSSSAITSVHGDGLMIRYPDEITHDQPWLADS